MTLPEHAFKWPPVIWGVVVVGAMPLTWLVATMGFTLAVASPIRDVVVLLAWSISEEIVFRGGIQPLIARARARRASSGVPVRDVVAHISWANLLTSLLFCAVHAFHKPLPVVLGLMPVSLVLGASLERSQRLWVPVALHAYFNLLLYGASVAIVG